MITAGALFVLVAPAAQASLDRILPARAPLAKQHKVALKHHSTPKVKTGGTASRTTPLYIYVPGPALASSGTSANDCATSGNNCTDQQLCDIWGMNCDLAVSTPTTAAPQVEVAPVGTVANDSSSTQSNTITSSTSDNSSTSNASTDSSGEDC